MVGRSNSSPVGAPNTAAESHVGVFRVLGRVNFSGWKLGRKLRWTLRLPVARFTKRRAIRCPRLTGVFDDWTGGQFAGWSTEHRATESHVGVFRVLGRVNFSGRKLGQQIAAIGDIPASFRWLAKVPRDRRLHSAGSRRCLGIVGFVRRSRVFDGWTVEQFAGWSTEHSRRFPRGSFSSFWSCKLSWPETWRGKDLTPFSYGHTFAIFLVYFGCMKRNLLYLAGLVALLSLGRDFVFPVHSEGCVDLIEQWKPLNRERAT